MTGLNRLTLIYIVAIQSYILMTESVTIGSRKSMIAVSILLFISTLTLLQRRQQSPEVILYLAVALSLLLSEHQVPSHHAHPFLSRQMLVPQSAEEALAGVVFVSRAVQLYVDGGRQCVRTMISGGETRMTMSASKPKRYSLSDNAMFTYDPKALVALLK
jgi:hypothetical protein